ncbi:MAG: asparaginase domain-containing protein [Verrucomicrobiales bacterium]|nr:asparaginase domain-containing protein [Verrucomicrobiales bacterium]
MTDSPSLRIRAFATGGTIDKVYFDATSSYEIGDPQIGPLLKEANVTFEFEVVSLLRKDSLELTDDDRRMIRDSVESAPETRILITHGTDTMTDTAAVLKGIEGKTIVFTGSMLPAKFRQNDALFNVGCAVGAVQTLPPGVYIAMNGCIFPAGTVRKNRDKRRFETITGDQDSV